MHGLGLFIITQRRHTSPPVIYIYVIVIVFDFQLTLGVVCSRLNQTIQSNNQNNEEKEKKGER